MMHCDSRLTKAISEAASELGYTFSLHYIKKRQQQSLSAVLCLEMTFSLLYLLILHQLMLDADSDRRKLGL